MLLDLCTRRTELLLLLLRLQRGRESGVERLLVLEPRHQGSCTPIVAATHPCCSHTLHAVHRSVIILLQVRLHNVFPHRTWPRCRSKRLTASLNRQTRSSDVWYSCAAQDLYYCPCMPSSLLRKSPPSGYIVSTLAVFMPLSLRLRMRDRLSSAVRLACEEPGSCLLVPLAREAGALWWLYGSWWFEGVGVDKVGIWVNWF